MVGNARIISVMDISAYKLLIIMALYVENVIQNLG